eukprot:SAG22_NODE_5785_length_952_cov_3.691676_2_plen_55_part_01
MGTLFFGVYTAPSTGGGAAEYHRLRERKLPHCPSLPLKLTLVAAAGQDRRSALSG